MISALTKKREMWRHVQRTPFPPVALVVEPENAPMRTVPFGLFRQHGFRKFLLVTRSEARLKTATRGTVDLVSSCCGVEINLDPDAPTRFSLNANTTYRELLRAAQDAEAGGRVLGITL